jgi:glycosyltransferase involved in cell wall biosynthesis
MCDPLGRSQVLPYLVQLAKRGYSISLISFEKPDSRNQDRAAVEQICGEAGISWHPLRYHKSPPVLSSVYDLMAMRRLAFRLHRRKPFDFVHCRSYLPGLVGLALKRRCGLPFIFDMRGFWADERVEGGLWNLSNPLYAAVFNYFKRRESELLDEADEIVILTEAGKSILLERRATPNDGPPIEVIPCCVDFDAFAPADPADRTAARRLLGVSPDAPVVAYLGSIGTWYMMDEMLDFFRVQVDRHPASTFLIVSRDPPDAILSAARERGIPSDRLIIRPATREEVPRLLAAADYGLFFIKPVFSKKASSPTKMGEFLALELPMVTNGDVGDVEQIVAETGAGVVVEGFSRGAYAKALEELESLRPDINRWRSAAHRWLDLEAGVNKYEAVYRSVVARLEAR